MTLSRRLIAKHAREIHDVPHSTAADTLPSSNRQATKTVGGVRVAKGWDAGRRFGKRACCLARMLVYYSVGLLTLETACRVLRRVYATVWALRLTPPPPAAPALPSFGIVGVCTQLLVDEAGSKP